MRDLTELELQILEVDERIRPIATRPIDFNDPNFRNRLAPKQAPLDEANIRGATETLLETLVAEYATSDDETRTAIRAMFARYQHFAWAASFATPPVTARDFRHHLILFSMLDQGRDSRDALLTLEALSAQARAAGIDINPIAREVAEMSSDVNTYGMGSTQRMLANL
jgi:hypothetical protein